MRRFAVFGALLLAAHGFAFSAFAQAPPQRIRGTISSVTGDSMVVHATDDTDVTILLTPETAIRVDTPSSLAAIQPGSTLAIVSTGAPDKQEAVGVRAMTQGVTLRPGISSWDLLPESTMTNAVVEGQQVATSGQEMTLKAGDKTVQMAFTAKTVVALEAPGGRSTLVPGAHVAVFAAPGADASITARAVIVGTDGLTPPV